MLIKIVILIGCAIYTASGDVRSFVPGFTKEPNYKNEILFKYDRNTHFIMTRIRLHLHECFLYNTTDQERIEVHTEHGLRTIESKILRLIPIERAALSPLTDDEKKDFSPFKYFCRLHEWYRLN